MLACVVVTQSSVTDRQTDGRTDASTIGKTKLKLECDFVSSSFYQLKVFSNLLYLL